MNRRFVLRFRQNTKSPLLAALVICAGLGFTRPALAVNYTEIAWASGDVTLNLNLADSKAPTVSASGLLDGSTTWTQVFLASMGEWNAHMVRSKLVANAVATTPGENNGVNDIFFASTIYGEDFGEGVLGVTMRSTQNAYSNSIYEADIAFNRAYTWNSYRGNIKSSPEDFRRVATHELGHLIGLSHPDDDHPAQDVAAIMNSTVSNVDSLQADDITGVTTLYGTALSSPNITQQPTSKVVNVGDILGLDYQVNGAAPSAAYDPNTTYYWLFKGVGLEQDILFTHQESLLQLGLAQTYDSGVYNVVVTNPDGMDISEDVTLTVKPVETSDQTHLANLSTRAIAGAGDRTLTVGFVISGTAAKRIMLRAVGPTLGAAPYNLAGTLADPKLTILRPTGEAIVTNDNWEVANTATPTEITNAASTVGAFALNAGSKDAVIIASLQPGAYTAQVTGASATEGIVNVEAYDLDPNANSSRLINLSTRGFVGNDANRMIAGLVVSGPAPRTYLLRVAGDTLQQYGVQGTLDDPVMTMFRGLDVVRANDDWDDPETLQPMLTETIQNAGGFPLTDRQESVLKMTLAPGAYTVQVSSFDDVGDGVALVEVYELSTP